MIDSVILVAFSALVLSAADSGGPVKAAASPSTPSPVLESVTRFTGQRPAFMEGQTLERGSKCNMETLNGAPWGTDVLAVPNTSVIKIGGWGIDEKLKQAPSEVYIRLEDKDNHALYAKATLDERPDVASYFNEAKLTKSGYHVSASVDDIAPGEYKAMIVMSVGGRAILCDCGRKVRFGPAR
jgi:hypothetical protein